MILFRPNCFWMFPAAVLTKVTYWDIEISKIIYFFLEKEGLKQETHGP